MNKQNEQENEIIARSEQIRRLLDEAPADILIDVIVEKIQHEPSEKVRKVVQTVSQQAFSGPIPPPSLLNEYDSVQDGLADRIVTMAESQQKHRHSLESKSVEAAIKVEARGQNYALVVSLFIIIGALYLIDSGREISGSILAGGTLTGLAYIFITGRKKESNSDSQS